VINGMQADPEACYSRTIALGEVCQ